MESLTDLAAAIPDLSIEVPDRRNWYSLRLDELPASLRADLEAWLSADQGANPRLRRARLNRNERRRHRKPIRPSTAASYLRLILEFISMQAKAGIPFVALASPEHAAAARSVALQLCASLSRDAPAGGAAQDR